MYRVINEWTELRRCRRTQFVIVSDRMLPVDCAVCDKTIQKGEHNRAEYRPRLRRGKVMHYDCAWNQIFGDIFGVPANKVEVVPAPTAQVA